MAGNTGKNHHDRAVKNRTQFKAPNGKELNQSEYEISQCTNNYCFCPNRSGWLLKCVKQ